VSVLIRQKRARALLLWPFPWVTKPLLLLSLFGLSNLSPIHCYVSWSLNSQTDLTVDSVDPYDFDDDVVADQDVFVFVSCQHQHLTSSVKTTKEKPACGTSESLQT
jgi:hypothetical protein